VVVRNAYKLDKERLEAAASDSQNNGRLDQKSKL